MPTRNVFLPHALDTYVKNAVASRRFSSASEVMRTALRLLIERDAEDAHDSKRANATRPLGFREKTGA